MHWLGIGVQFGTVFGPAFDVRDGNCEDGFKSENLILWQAILHSVSAKTRIEPSHICPNMSKVDK